MKSGCAAVLLFEALKELPFKHDLFLTPPCTRLAELPAP